MTLEMHAAGSLVQTPRSRIPGSRLTVHTEALWYTWPNCPSVPTLREVKVTQSYPTPCSPMDYTVHGIPQARILACIAFPFSSGSSQPRDRTQVSHIAGGFFTS